jgi:hypothetical protein
MSNFKFQVGQKVRNRLQDNPDHPKRGEITDRGRQGENNIYKITSHGWHSEFALEKLAPRFQVEILEMTNCPDK